MRFRLETVTSLAVALLLASAASAQTFIITGKASSAGGGFIDLPAAGSSPCPSILQNFRVPLGLTPNMLPLTMTLGGTVPFPGTPFGFNFSGGPAFPGGCMANNPAVQHVTTTGMGGPGAGFTVPVGLISQPAPGTPATVLVPLVPAIQQLATSFAFTGPQSVPFEAQNQTMATGMNTAPFRQMRSNNSMAHTGRASGNFTFCFGTVVSMGANPPNPLCTNILGAAAAFPALIKNTAGPNTFGGTMGLVLTTGPNTSSLALIAPFGMTTPVPSIGLQIIAGMGSRAAGRGYAAYDDDMLASGPRFSMFALSGGGLVTMVSGPVAPPLPPGLNRNLGFPFTTGQVVVRNSGTAQGMVNALTHTVSGFDTTTTMGNRNIQLVAGHLSASTTQGMNGTPNFTAMRLPEPQQGLGLLAGAMGLGVIALWRSLRRR